MIRQNERCEFGHRQATDVNHLGEGCVVCALMAVNERMQSRQVIPIGEIAGNRMMRDLVSYYQITTKQTVAIDAEKVGAA